jgi:uncharacterized protein (UPF0332 family)
MTGEGFLTLAMQLSQSADEARLRTAVSRAYYAAFHVARSYLADAGIAIPSSEHVHKKLAMALANAGHPALTEASRHVSNLRADRNEADYDLDSTMWSARSAALLRIDSAKRVVELIHDYRTGPERETILAALRQAASSLGLPVAP